jgi:hypothetical protein
MTRAVGAERNMTVDPNDVLNNFAGIPVVINPYMPEGEVWIIQQGEKSTITCHEGPHAGESIEVWLKKPQIVKIVNLGKDWMKPELPREFKFEPKIGDWPWPNKDENSSK